MIPEDIAGAQSAVDFGGKQPVAGSIPTPPCAQNLRSTEGVSS